MKISEIINELTELKEYIGDKDLEACTANDTTAGVNVMYQNDDGGITVHLWKAKSWSDR